MQKLPTKQEWEKHIDSLRSIQIKTNKEKLKRKFVEAVKKNIPNEKFGIMFSGGIDSTLIALICKQFTNNFICYSVGLKGSPDIAFARKVAKDLKLKLKIIELDLEKAEKIIKNVVKIIKEPDVTKVGVGSVVYTAIKEAKKDGVKKLFSGLGSEELFAGYQRHAEAKDINKECWNGLKYMYDRDFTRDFKIADKLKAKILLPFLDDDVILYGINFSEKEKINNDLKKVIIRKIAIDLGLKKEFAMRKKKAAQYGSKFTGALDKIAKRNDFKYKKAYLKSLR